jgi:hypothetical protein
MTSSALTSREATTPYARRVAERQQTRQRRLGNLYGYCAGETVRVTELLASRYFFIYIDRRD